MTRAEYNKMRQERMRTLDFAPKCTTGRKSKRGGKYPGKKSNSKFGVFAEPANGYRHNGRQCHGFYL